MITGRFGRAGWSVWHALGALTLTAVAFVATRQAWADILHIALTDEENSHILLVPFVAAWMAWARRIRLRLCEPRGQWVGPIVLAIGWGLFTLGYERSIQVFWHAGAVTVVVGAAISVLGKHILFRFLPAFLVLVFLIPVPGVVRQQIALPLQTATAVVTQAIFETFGVPVERQANLLVINGASVAVAEACNGMRMVFALVLVSYAFAFSMPLRDGVRLLVLLASPLAALACNVVRLIPTVWLYGYSDKKLADSFHDYSGWLMLPIAFVMLLGIIRTLRWALVPVGRYNLAYQ